MKRSSSGEAQIERVAVVRVRLRVRREVRMRELAVVVVELKMTARTV